MHSGIRTASIIVRPLILAIAAATAWAIATAAWSQSSSSSSEAPAPSTPPPPAGGGSSSPDWLLILLSLALFALAAVGGVLALRYFMAKHDHDVPDYKPEEIKVFNSTRIVARSAGGFAVAGLLVVAALCLGFAKGDPWLFLAYLGTDVLVAGAAAAAGGVGGFIFGIPRTRDAVDRATDSDGSAGGQKSKAVLLANTNLERISDWLTTLLIGATLVQLRDLPHWLVAVGNTLNTDFSNGNVVPFVLVFFFGVGFLGIYLVTRLYLTVTFWQTLDMVSGADLTATEAASTNPTGPDLAGARARLENALTADDAERLAAVQFVDNAGIRPDQAGDFDFSLALARVLLKLLAASAADDPAKRKQDLRTVVGVITTDANTAAKLKDDLASARYTSGDPALDAELTTALG